MQVVEGEREAKVTIKCGWVLTAMIKLIEKCAVLLEEGTTAGEEPLTAVEEIEFCV